jgi:hypothetical protein
MDIPAGGLMAAVAFQAAAVLAAAASRGAVAVAAASRVAAAMAAEGVAGTGNWFTFAIAEMMQNEPGRDCSVAVSGPVVVWSKPRVLWIPADAGTWWLSKASLSQWYRGAQGLTMT